MKENVCVKNLGNDFHNEFIVRFFWLLLNLCSWKEKKNPIHGIVSSCLKWNWFCAFFFSYKNIPSFVAFWMSCFVFFFFFLIFLLGYYACFLGQYIKKVHTIFFYYVYDITSLMVLAIHRYRLVWVHGGEMAYLGSFWG